MRFDPEEPFTDAMHLVAGDTDPGIRYLQDDVLILVPQSHGDTSFVAVLERVSDEVHCNLFVHI